MPALGETVAAATGLGLHVERETARVPRTVEHLRDATVVFSDGRMLARRLGHRWVRLESEAGLLRSWGDCYGHCLVATGRADVMLDPVMNAWDCAALLPIVREAGGRFSDWTGVARIDGGDAVSTNEALHSARAGTAARRVSAACTTRTDLSADYARMTQNVALIAVTRQAGGLVTAEPDRPAAKPRQ